MTDRSADAPLAAGLVRKAIHLSLAAIPVCWAYGAVGTTAIRVGLAIAATVALVTELLRQRDARVGARFDALFGRWLKPHERTEFTGASWLLFAMLGAVLFYPAPAARAALWAGIVGDAAAALVGTALKKQPVGSPGKSIAGAVACAVTTALGVWWLAPTTWGIAVALGTIAAAAEWPSRFGDDNARVTLMTGAAAWALGVG